MTDIRGIHYEISEPVFNKDDGFWYQRRRQVDGQGNLVGIGDQPIKLPNPNSLDGQYEPNLDLVKLGKLGGDFGQIGYGIIKRDPGATARGAFSLIGDMRNGVQEDYKSWPGTDRPWQQGDIPAPSEDGAPSSDSVQPGLRPQTEITPTRKLVSVTGSTSPAALPNSQNPRAQSGSSIDGIAPRNPNDASALAAALEARQQPLTLNDAYLLYLKRLAANRPQVSGA